MVAAGPVLNVPNDVFIYGRWLELDEVLGVVCLPSMRSGLTLEAAEELAVPTDVRNSLALSAAAAPELCRASDLFR